MKIEIKKLNNDEIEQMGIKHWPIWTKEVSEFDWFYDSQEMCLILEGRIIVSSQHEVLEINAGDFVVFPKGLSCQWHVLEHVRKHYKFE